MNNDTPIRTTSEIVRDPATPLDERIRLLDEILERVILKQIEMREQIDGLRKLLEDFNAK